MAPRVCLVSARGQGCAWKKCHFDIGSGYFSRFDVSIFDKFLPRPTGGHFLFSHRSWSYAAEAFSGSPTPVWTWRAFQLSTGKDARYFAAVSQFSLTTLCMMPWICFRSCAEVARPRICNSMPALSTPPVREFGWPRPACANSSPRCRTVKCSSTWPATVSSTSRPGPHTRPSMIASFLCRRTERYRSGSRRCWDPREKTRWLHLLKSLCCQLRLGSSASRHRMYRQPFWIRESESLGRGIFA